MPPFINCWQDPLDQNADKNHQNLTLNDLRHDPILIRKIKRMQQAEAAEAEESSEDEAVQAPRAGARPMNVKSTSALPSRTQVPSTQQPPQSSMIEDLGDPSDDEEPSQQAPPMSSMVEDLGDPSESEDEL